MTEKQLKEVIEMLDEKYQTLENFKGQETILKDIVRSEIIAIETVLKICQVDYNYKSCYKCAEPDTAAKDDKNRFICWECMMEN